MDLLYFSFKLTYFPLSWELWSSIKIFFGVYSVHTYTISITSSSTLPPPSYLSFCIILLYILCYTELRTGKTKLWKWEIKCRKLLWRKNLIVLLYKIFKCLAKLELFNRCDCFIVSNLCQSELIGFDHTLVDLWDKL